MKKIILYFILSIGFVSCKQIPSPLSVEYTILVDSLSETLPPVKNILYIPLETSETSLIRNIDKIITKDSIFYIFDNMSKKIFLFNQEGKFLRNIDKVGQGPGEYTSPSDMEVDNDGNVYVSDFPAKRIIKYNLGNGNDFEVINIGVSFMDFVIHGKFIYLSRMIKNGAFSVNLARWNMDTHEMEILKENKLLEGNTIGFANHYFYRTGEDCVYYYERFNPIGYRIVGDSLSKSISIKSENFPTEDDVKKWSTNGRRHLEFASMDISACYETEKYLLITCNTKPFHTYCLVDKKTKVVSSTESLLKDGILGYEICASTGKNFVSYFIPNEGNLINVRKMSVTMNSVNKERTANLSIEDNPVLVLFNFE